MADLPGAVVKFNDAEINGDSVHSEALMEKFGSNMNALIDRKTYYQVFLTGADWTKPNEFVDNVYVYNLFYDTYGLAEDLYQYPTILVAKSIDELYLKIFENEDPLYEKFMEDYGDDPIVNKYEDSNCTENVMPEDKVYISDKIIKYMKKITGEYSLPGLYITDFKGNII